MIAYYDDSSEEPNQIFVIKSSRGIGEENCIILLAVSFVCYLGITQMLNCRLIHLKLPFAHLSLKP